MSKIEYSFRVGGDLEIPNCTYTTIPFRYSYPENFRKRIYGRKGIIFDQVSLRTLNLRNENYFYAIVRKLKEEVEKIHPDLVFLPAILRKDKSLKENIKASKEIIEWIENGKKFAGLISGETEDEWIEWINLSRDRELWGILVRDKVKAAKLLVKELKKIEHIHIFESNWLNHQEDFKELNQLNVDKITFDDTLFTLLQQTNQDLVLENSSLILKTGSMTPESFIEKIQAFLTLIK